MYWVEYKIVCVVVLQGFQRHVKMEHYQWAYLFFFIHLDETRPNDYSALELYVHKMVSI